MAMRLEISRPNVVQPATGYYQSYSILRGRDNEHRTGTHEEEHDMSSHSGHLSLDLTLCVCVSLCLSLSVCTYIL